MKKSIQSLLSATKSFLIIAKTGKHKWIIGHIFMVLFEASIPFVLLYGFNLLLNSITEENNGLSPLLIVLIYSTVFLLFPIIQILHSTVSGKGMQVISHQIDMKLAGQIEAVELSYLDSVEGQNTLDEFGLMQNAIKSFPNKLIFIFSQLYAFMVSFAAILSFNRIFGLIMIVLTIPFSLLSIYFEKKSEDFRIKNAPDVRRFSYYRWMLTDRSTAKDIRMYNLTDPISGRYNCEKNEYLKENKKLDLWKLIRALPMTLLKYSGEFAFLAYLIVQGVNGSITVGEIILYSGLSLSMIETFNHISSSLGEFFEYDLKHIQRYNEFEAQVPELSDINKKCVKDIKTISFENVRFKYPTSDCEVIKGISFTINKGERIAVVGINGAGKTTILKLLMGLYPVTEGQIKINGIPLEEYDILSVRRLFGTLFQSYSSFNITLRENIALSSIDDMYDDERILNAIKLANANEILKKCNGNLDTYLGKEFDDNGVELSLGQWQKVALARAYFKKAPVIVFDEPSASLDAIAEDAIFKQIEQLSKEKTCIMISHRISFSNNASKILVINDGKIAESGTHEELILNNGLYSELYELQKDRYQ